MDAETVDENEIRTLEKIIQPIADSLQDALPTGLIYDERMPLHRDEVSEIL